MVRSDAREFSAVVKRKRRPPSGSLLWVSLKPRKSELRPAKLPHTRLGVAQAHALFALLNFTGGRAGYVRFLGGFEAADQAFLFDGHGGEISFAYFLIFRAR